MVWMCLLQLCFMVQEWSIALLSLGGLWRDLSMPAEKIPSNAIGNGGARGENPYGIKQISLWHCVATDFEIPGWCFDLPWFDGHRCRSDGLNVSITTVLYGSRMINSLFNENGGVQDQAPSLPPLSIWRPFSICIWSVLVWASFKLLILVICNLYYTLMIRFQQESWLYCNCATHP